MDTNDGGGYDAIAIVSAKAILGSRQPSERLSKCWGRVVRATLKSALSSLIAWLGSFAYKSPAGQSAQFRNGAHYHRFCLILLSLE